MIKHRGRPQDNDTLILEYTQFFKDHNGSSYKWTWNKNISKSGPISVTIEDPQYAISDRLNRELESIEKKYIPKKGDRKPRVTKEDKLRMEQIEKELIEFHYSKFPEDRPNIKIKKTKK
jgi:hypothetical protein